MASTRPNSVRLFSVKPISRHDGEGADQRDRHVDHRQDHGPPVLQEHEHDDGHQDHRVAQGVEDLVDRLADEGRGVVDDLVIQAVGKARLQLLHLGVDAAGGVQGVGAGKLVDGQGHGRLAVQRAGSGRTAASPVRRGLPSASAITTSRSRTMPEACGAGVLGGGNGGACWLDASDDAADPEAPAWTRPATA